MITIAPSGSIGVNKDIGSDLIPIESWTDSLNMRFLDGMAMQFYGHNQLYGTPSNTPQFVMPVYVSGALYWIYATAANTYCTTITGGSVVETDLTHATPRTGVVNQWTGTLLSGIPILNVGDTSKVPMYWDLNTSNNFVDLTNWPASTYCKSLRSFKNFLIALNITKTTTNYPYMVKWSDPALPGSLPSTWDETDATANAGEIDIAEGQDVIVDGMQLGDSFLIYKERSVWRMDLVGGIEIFRLTKIDNRVGAMNRNCIALINGAHIVLAQNDVFITDGFTAKSILDKMTRRWFFSNIDSTNYTKAFCVSNPYFNEVFICYPSTGNSVCDKAMVYNYVDGTVSFRELPNVNHAEFGPVNDSLLNTWSVDEDDWASDVTIWDNPDLAPTTTRVLLASSDTKIFLLDALLSFNGSIPDSYLERVGLDFGDNTKIKLVRGIRPNISGSQGLNITISVGHHDDPFDDVTWDESRSYTIGETIQADFFVSGRYIAIKFSGDTAYFWRLDGYKVDVITVGEW